MAGIVQTALFFHDMFRTALAPLSDRPVFHSRTSQPSFKASSRVRSVDSLSYTVIRTVPGGKRVRKKRTV